MARQTDTESVEMRYLLGTLSEGEKTSFEASFFADDQSFEELEIVEGELIDAYVRGELSGDDHKRFSQNLAKSPRLTERAQFAKMLAGSVAPAPLSQSPTRAKELTASVDRLAPKSPATSWWKSSSPTSPQPMFRLALAAAVVFVLLGGVVLFAGWLRVRSESTRLANERVTLERLNRERETQSAEQRSRAEQLTAELQKERNERAEREKLIAELQSGLKEPGQTSQRTAASPAFLFLFPGATRGSSGPQDLLIPENTAKVRIRLALDANDYPRYAVEIRTPAGTEVLRRDGLKAQSSGSVHTLLLEFPAARLTSGSYQVRVSGVSASGDFETVSDYSFHTSKR